MSSIFSPSQLISFVQWLSVCRMKVSGYECGYPVGREQGLADGFATGFNQGVQLAQEVLDSVAM